LLITASRHNVHSCSRVLALGGGQLDPQGMHGALVALTRPWCSSRCQRLVRARASPTRAPPTWFCWKPRRIFARAASRCTTLVARRCCLCSLGGRTLPRRPATGCHDARRPATCWGDRKLGPGLSRHAHLCVSPAAPRGGDGLCDSRPHAAGFASHRSALLGRTCRLDALAWSASARVWWLSRRCASASPWQKLPGTYNIP